MLERILTELSFIILGGLSIICLTIGYGMKKHYSNYYGFFERTKRNPYNGRLTDYNPKGNGK